MNALRTYLDCAQGPIAWMRQRMMQHSFRQACLGYFVSALSWVLFFNIADDLSIPVFCLKLTILFVTEVIAGYFMAALCGLFLDLIRVKVSSARLFTMVGNVGFVRVVLIAFALISAACPQLHLGVLSLLLLLGVFVVQLGCLVVGLERMWGVDTLEALGGWLFGFIPVGACFTLAGIFLIWFFVLLF